MQEHYVTLFDSGYLPQGLSLHASMRRHAPDSTLWVVCIDDDAYRILASMDLPNLHTLRLCELETPELLAVKPTRSRAEYCWTLTPFAPRWVMEADASIQRVTYLDSDMFFRSSPHRIFQEFNESEKDVLITEHDFDPRYDRAKEFGRFCVQFLTVRHTESGLRVLSWWQEKCLEWCFYRKEPNRFGDQKYLDRWPSLFGDAVHVLHRNELLGAPWNASRRDSRVAMYHFHSLRVLDSDQTRLWSGYNLGSIEYRLFYREYIDELSIQIPKIPKTVLGRFRMNWYQKLLVWKNELMCLERVAPIPREPTASMNHRVLHVCTAFNAADGYGGPSSVMANQMKLLPKYGIEVTGLSISGASSPQIHNMTMLPLGHRIPGLRFSGWIPKRTRSVPNLLQKADIVHIHFGREFFPIEVAWLCKRQGIPYILQTHGMLTTIRKSREVPSWLLDKLLIGPLVESAAAVLALQEIEAKALRGRFPKANVRIMPNGIPPREFVPASSRSKNITFLSRFNARKRPTDLIHAFRQIPDDLSRDWTLRMIGSDDGELARMIKAASGDPRIQIQPAVSSDKIWEEHAKAGIFALPSVEEPFSMAVLEAMSVGSCCLVTEGCHNSGLLASSQAAIVCENATDSIATSLSRLMSDPDLRKRMGESAYKASREIFGQDTVIAQLCRIYCEALVR